MAVCETPERAQRVECAETLEVPGAYVCLTCDTETMNLVFARATLYSEGDSHYSPLRWPPPALTSEVVLQKRKHACGHDIPGRHANHFFMRGEQERRLGPHEEVFESDVLSKIRARSGDDFVLLGVSGNSDLYPVDVMGHELLHAQFFLDDRFRQVSLEFYRSLPHTTKRGVSRILTKHQYHVGDESHVANELVAYLLQPAAESYLMGRYVDRCASLLLKRFSDAGVVPVQIY